MVFEPKLTLDIKGKFIIPAYQRGYRWGKSEVTRLLDDIYERAGTNQNYCLQPVVVKRIDDEPSYELIDGQQRLTTIYLILKVLESLNLPLVTPYRLKYETRTSSETYLDTLDAAKKNDYIDYRYIYDAATYIKEWFGTDQNEAISRAWDIFNLLKKQVQVLWYEADASENSQELFARLNIGKIPLTNAELVKALFLNRGVSSTDKPSPLQEQIAAQWDNLERELHNESLWSFLTNENPEKYDTRLDLLFDFFTPDRADRKDKYSIFFELSRKLKEDYNGSTELLWRNLYEYFLKLREWYHDNDLYHRAGYIVAVNNEYPLSRLVTETEDMGYKDKIAELDKLIEAEVALNDKGKDTESALKELSYKKDSHKIEKILLLLNVRTTAASSDKSRFPFDKYKSKKRNEGWSLEHIHAQHSEGLNKREQWIEWLKENVRSLEAIDASQKRDELIAKVNERLKDDSSGIAGKELDQVIFNSLRTEVTALLSTDNMEEEELHSISNLALLGFRDNIVLSNSLFETKRQKIIDMDSTGVYVPVCTRNVFLKYYTPAGANQPHYWSEKDREAYLRQILETVYNIKNA